MDLGNIHPNDDMFTGSIEHYANCGSQMADLAEHAARLAASSCPRLLELPCGYGRVTRHLARRFEAGSVEVADIMVPAVEFVVGEFGVSGIAVSDPVNQFPGIPEDAFDVAVMGSLLTHLSEESAVEVLQHFLRKLRRGGIAVITTHGERSYEMLNADGWHEVSPTDRLKLLEAYEQGRHEFVQYDPSHSFERKTVDYIGPSYGVSITSPAWMREVVRRLGHTVLEYRTAGWDNHQDVFFIRREEPRG